jgi:hypothetical protein
MNKDTASEVPDPPSQKEEGERTRVWVSFSLLIGFMLLAWALALEFTTFKTKEAYKYAWWTAVGLTGAADMCFVYALLRGRLLARVLSVLLLLPTLIVLWGLVHLVSSWLH